MLTITYKIAPDDKDNWKKLSKKHIRSVVIWIVKKTMNIKT